jgi:hypothetical protein
MNKDENNLERLIRENKEKFDYHLPPKEIWQNIEDKLPQPKRNIIPMNWLSLIAVAASFLIVGIIGANYFISKENDPQIEQIEKFYGNTYNIQYNQLSKNVIEDEELVKELKELDAIEEELKNEIHKNYGDTRQMMIKRLLDHYKTKIKLIELINEKSAAKTQKEI